MCGLTGLWRVGGGPTDDLAAVARCMAGTLVHRGPDDGGVWVDPDAGVAFGFRRLAILDLSPAGHQPMCSTGGRLVGLFNGEVYNFRELRAELEAQGAQFRGSSDTEVVLAAVEAWGFRRAVERLWGMFAIAVWDREARTLWLARDRMGKKPLYYGHLASGFVFGSELKALCAHHEFAREVDEMAVALFLRHGYVPAPWAIYRGARKLPPGHYAVVRDGDVAEVRPYWDVVAVAARGSADSLPDEPEAATDELEALLGDAVARRMVADVPLGAFLSGGIDSSAVVALMRGHATRPVQTFCVGFEDTAYSEADAARAVARHLGTEHHELLVTPTEAQAVVPSLARIYDEPFADSSQIPTLLVSRFARQSVTVALSGDGGDELFYGYRTYAWAEQLQRWHGSVPVPVRRVAAAAARHVAAPLGRRAERARRAAELLGADSPEGVYLGLISAWGGRAPVSGARALPETAWTDAAGRPAWATERERMVLTDLRTYLPDDILVKVDRASMAERLEARCPLLDHRVVEFSWRVPASLKVRDGQTKWLLRQVLYRHVPRALVDRPKQGFAVPIGAWLLGPLRPWAEELLSVDALRASALLDVRRVRGAWDAFVAGRHVDARDLWHVLMLQAWVKEWLPTGTARAIR